MLMDVSAELVEGWAEELAALAGGLGHLFARPEPREVFADLIEGLLSDLGRKNGWTMAGRAGHATPHRIQKFLGEASWSADALLAEREATGQRDRGTETFGVSHLDGSPAAADRPGLAGTLTTRGWHFA